MKTRNIFPSQHLVAIALVALGGLALLSLPRVQGRVLRLPVSMWSWEQRSSAQQTEVLLQDDFNRANAAALGSPWVEAGEVFNEYIRPDGIFMGTSFIELDNAALAFHYRTHSQRPQNIFKSGNDGPLVYRPLTHAVTAFPVAVSLKYAPNPDEHVGHDIGLMAAADGFTPIGPGSRRQMPRSGLALQLARSSLVYPNSRVYLVKYANGMRTVLAERALPFQLVASGMYVVQLNIAVDLTLMVQVSNGSTSAQLTANAGTLNFPLDQFFLADTDGGVSFDAPSGDLIMRFDDVLVSQPSVCAFTLASASNTVPASGGNYAVMLTAAPSNCAWTASSNANWVTITAGASGTGNGTINYSVAANTTGSARTATLTIAGQAYNVAQDSNCPFTVTPAQQSFPASSGNSTVGVVAPNGCAWTATTNANWITITSGASGSGNGTVNFTVAAQTAFTTRTGTLTVAGQSLTITQAGLPCPATFNLKPSTPTGTKQANTLAVVSAASFKADPVAPEAIATAFGSNLAAVTKTAPDSDPNTPGIQLPTNFEGTQVKVNGTAAGLFYVSPFQINFLIPPATVAGTARIEVFRNNATTPIATGTIEVKAFAPAFFIVGQEETLQIPAGYLVRTPVGSRQTYESLTRLDAATGKVVSREIDLGPEGERVDLILFFTGLRGIALSDIRLLLGSQPLFPQYANKQGELAGLDQMNVFLPRSLLQRLSLNGSPLKLTVAVRGQSFSQNAFVRLAVPRTQVTGQVQINSVNASLVTAGAELTINGAGFSLDKNENRVSFVDGNMQEVVAEVLSAANNQLTVRVPFGAGSGAIYVNTPNAIGRSVSNLVQMRTSISGFVQNTKRQSISNLTVRVRDTNISAQTNANGSFVLPGVPPGQVELEFDGPTAGLPYPKLKSKMSVLANRDNQFPGPMEMMAVSGATLALHDNGSARETVLRVPVEFARPDNPAQLQPGMLRLELSPNAVVQFPCGSTATSLTLTAFERGRAPVDLPPGFFSTSIAQLTPFGATITPGGKLIFPNSDNLPAGSKPRLFKFVQTTGDPKLGEFVDVGEAVVSADGQRVETATNAITEASYYFVSKDYRPNQVTTLAGYLVEADGRPVRRALVQARGRSAFTNNFGGFVLETVPVLAALDQLTIEASFVRPNGEVARTQLVVANLKPGETQQLTTDLVLPPRSTNRPPYLFAPAALTIQAGDTRDFDFIAGDPDAGQAVQLAVSQLPANLTPFATIISRGSDVYSLRLAPPANLATTQATLTLTVTDPQGEQRTQAIGVTIKPPANAAPVAYSQSITTPEDTARAFTLTGGPVGVALTYRVISAPLWGTLSGTAPNLTYTPALNYNGLDSFTFSVSNGGRESEPATVSIAIKPDNDAPVLQVPLTAQTVNGGQVLNFVVTATDVDVAQTLTPDVLNLPPGATFIPLSETSWQVNWTPTFTQKQTQPYAFEVKVCDNGAPVKCSETQTVNLTVEATWASLKLYGGSITGLAVSGDNVFACGGGGNFLSTTKGNSWKRLASIHPQAELGADTMVAKEATVIAGSRGYGLYRSVDNGVTWNKTTGNQRIDALTVSGSVYFAGVTPTDQFGAATGGQVHRSDDDGLTWSNKSNGLPNTPVLALAVNGTAVFAGTANFGIFSAGGGSGIYRTLNNGETWTAVNNGLTSLGVHALANTGSDLYAGTENGLFRSSNNGDSWTRIGATLTDQRVFALYANGNLLLAGTVAGGLFRSTDGGATWALAGLAKLDIRAFAAAGSTLFAATLSGGVYRSNNAGATWTQVNAGIESEGIQSIRITGETILVAGSSGSIYHSTNNGASWNTTSGLGTVNVNDTTLHNNIVFACSSGADPRSHLLPARTGAGVFRSNDNGLTWERTGTNVNDAYLDTIASNGTVLVTGGYYSSGPYLSIDNGINWTHQPSFGLMQGRLRVKNRRFLIGAYLSGIYRSDENGANWQVLSNSPNNAVAAGVVGDAIYAGSYNGGLARSTDDGSTWHSVGGNFFSNYVVGSVDAVGTTLYASGNSRGGGGGDLVFQSNDNGETWFPVLAGLPPGRSGPLIAKESMLFMGGGGAGLYRLTDSTQVWITKNTGITTKFINAVAANSTTYFAGTLGNGVFRSVNRGQTWTVSNDGLPQAASIQALAVNGATSYGGAFDRGIYRSTDNGEHWTDVSTGLASVGSKRVNVLKFKGADVFAATDDGVYRLAGGGNSWVKVSGGLGNQFVTALEISGNNLFAGTYGGGVFLSTNAGQNWTALNIGLPASANVTALGLSTDGAKLFAGTDGNGIYRSDDGGQHWTAVNHDIPATLNVYAFAAHGSKLYAGTIYGIFLSEDNGAHWQQLNAGLYDIFVTGLAVEGQNLIAGTRTGGVFTSQIPD